VGRTALIVLSVALLVGSAAAFTRSERLKLAPSPVGKPKFERHLSPTCGCRHATASLSLLVRRSERLDVSVVDADGAHVATLARAQEAAAGRVGFAWDGRNDDGGVVEDGIYRMKVRLGRDRRTILIPKTVRVDSAPPSVRIVESVSGTEGILIRYRTNEAVRVLLALDGKTVVRASKRSPGIGRLTWQPGGTAPASGLTLVGVDQAGNRSEQEPVSVATP